ncbi:hypothetical protein BBJ28_00015144 [Nothophytophthora sp. Chile5]|nr:hypothetical protein BBJ28_00015144 [Nothophytophthora sp. Chile5]
MTHWSSWLVAVVIPTSDASIGKVAREIEELKVKVHVEKTVRAYKEEYESIARVINELPSRRDITAYVLIAVMVD